MGRIFDHPQSLLGCERLNRVAVQHDSAHMNRNDSNHLSAFRNRLGQFTVAQLIELPGGIVKIKVKSFRVAIDEHGYRTLITNNFSSRSKRHGWDQNALARLKAK